MNDRQPTEIRIGDGGYVDYDGDVLPLEDFGLLGESELDVEVSPGDEYDDLVLRELFESKNETQQHRLREFAQKNGFYPSSVEELNYARAVDSVDAAKYLNIILLHQKTENPDDANIGKRTLLSIEARLIGYKTSAAADMYFLETLLRDVEAVPDSSVGWDSILHSVGDKRAIIDIMIHLEFEHFAEANDTTAKVKMKPYDEYYKAVDGFLSGMTTKAELLAIAQNVHDQQQARLDFWTEKIRQTAKHTVVAALAKKALESGL